MGKCVYSFIQHELNIQYASNDSSGEMSKT